VVVPVVLHHYIMEMDAFLTPLLLQSNALRCIRFISNLLPLSVLFHLYLIRLMNSYSYAIRNHVK